LRASAPYVPGWDCHGLPIEFKVSQGCARRATSNRPGASAPLRAHAELYRSPAHASSARRLGDWDHPYLTMDRARGAELRLFANLVARHGLSRQKPSIGASPAAPPREAEVEYPTTSPERLCQIPGRRPPGRLDVIWTTTRDLPPISAWPTTPPSINSSKWAPSSSSSRRCCSPGRRHRLGGLPIVRPSRRAISRSWSQHRSAPGPDAFSGISSSRIHRHRVRPSAPGHGLMTISGLTQRVAGYSRWMMTAAGQPPICPSNANAARWWARRLARQGARGDERC